MSRLYRFFRFVSTAGASQLLPGPNEPLMPSEAARMIGRLRGAGYIQFAGPDDTVLVRRDVLVQLLHCSQCGKHLYKPACGPTHALLKVHPEQHRDVAQEPQT